MEIIDKMFAVQEIFPNLRWDVEDNRLILTVVVADNEEEFLLGARRMFEPKPGLKEFLLAPDHEVNLG